MQTPLHLFTEKLVFLCTTVLSEAGDDVARNRTNDEGCGFQSWSPQRKIQVYSSEPLTTWTKDLLHRSTLSPPFGAEIGYYHHIFLYTPSRDFRFDSVHIQLGV